MKHKSLRTWVITIIACIFIHQVYIAIGTFLPKIADSAGLSIDTLRMAYADGNFLVYSSVLLGWLMCGILLYCGGKTEKLTRYGGCLLIAYSVICVGWELITLIGRHLSVRLIPMSVNSVLVVVVGVLLSVALVLLALYYRQRHLLAWSVVYAVLHTLYMVSLVWARCQASFSVRLFTINGVFAALGLVALLVYLFKWAKILKEK